jgi:fucose permease
MGGAVVPVIIGRIGDVAGLRAGVAFLYVTFGCVLSAGFWARPIITNATISRHDHAAETAPSQTN